jgi:hypothetical protein
MYPTLDSFNFIGWLNASVLALCAVTWILRLFFPNNHTTEPSILGRCFLAVDLLVLLFISYGVLLNINGVLDGSAPEKKSAVITGVIEDPFSPGWFFPGGQSILAGTGTAAVVTEIIKNPHSPGWFFPAGRAGLTGLNTPDNPRHIALRRHLIGYLLIGQEITFTQYKGFLGIPWVTDLRVDQYSVPQDLLTSNDPIIKKDIALAELNKQQWERGLEDAHTYASEEPEDIDFLISATEVLIKGGQAGPAVGFLRPFATTRPNYRLYVRYGEPLHQTGNREGAVEVYQAAARLDPKPILALYHLGYLLKAMGRFGEATVACERLLEIQPGYPMIKDLIHEMQRQSSILEAF